MDDCSLCANEGEARREISNRISTCTAPETSLSSSAQLPRCSPVMTTGRHCTEAIGD